MLRIQRYQNIELLVIWSHNIIYYPRKRCSYRMMINYEKYVTSLFEKQEKKRTHKMFDPFNSETSIQQHKLCSL